MVRAAIYPERHSDIERGQGRASSTRAPTPVTLSTPGITWSSFGGFGLIGVALYREGDSTTSAGIRRLFSDKRTRKKFMLWTIGVSLLGITHILGIH
jgi:hypothetical protein